MIRNTMTTGSWFGWYLLTGKEETKTSQRQSLLLPFQSVSAPAVCICLVAAQAASIALLQTDSSLQQELSCCLDLKATPTLRQRLLIMPEYNKEDTPFRDI
jgi:hypothetical protein